MEVATWMFGFIVVRYHAGVDSSAVIQVAGLTIAAVAVAVSLAALSFQLRIFERTMHSQVYQAMIANSLRIDELLIERPLLRKYIYGAAAVPPTDLSQEELDSFIEFVIDVLDNLVVQNRHIPPTAREGWKNFSNQIMNQPAVIDFMKRNGDWYRGTLT